MLSDDIDAVCTMAAVCFPDHPEDRAVFLQRLSLYPQGCLVLQGTGAQLGYAVAYPWPGDAVPPLNTLVDGLPDAPSVLYLHDLAVLPTARGGGLARAGLEHVIGLARAVGLSTLALVAVNQAEGFWGHLGFEPRQTPALVTKLASYGPDARYMVRPSDLC